MNDRNVRSSVRPELSEAMANICAARWMFFPETSVAVAVTSPPDEWDLVYASSPGAADLEEIGFNLCEGPRVVVFESHRPVLIEGLDDLTGRTWPSYAKAAAQHGFRSIFAFPVQLKGAVIGTLTLYSPIRLEAHERHLAVALRLADAAAVALSDWCGPTSAAQRLPSSPPGELFDYQVEIPQACGMIMIQLGVPISEAMLRLRAHAYVEDLSVLEVAQAVVQRSTRFGVDQGYLVNQEPRIRIRERPN